DRGGLRLRAALIVTESALAMVLLFGALLLRRSFLRLQAVEPGFDAADTLSFSLALPEARYPAPQDRQRITATILERLSRLPGVEAAGVATALPYSGGTQGFSIESVDGRSVARPGYHPGLVTQVVTPGYLRALRVPVLRGRSFDARDRREGPLVCLVDTRTAQELGPGRDPVGRTIEIGTDFDQGGDRPAGGDVIGVVGPMRQDDPAEPPQPTIYVLHAQFPIDSFSVVVRTRHASTALGSSVRAAVRAVDPDLAVASMRPLVSYLQASLVGARLRLLL